MDTFTYETVCADLTQGGTHKILNTETGIVGDLLLCNHGHFNVRVGHGSEVWPSSKCREITPDEEWKYRKDHH